MTSEYVIDYATWNAASIASLFAFVEMTERRDAETAISQLNGTEICGRPMNVNEARPKPEGGGGGGGGGGGRGGQGGRGGRGGYGGGGGRRY